MVYLSIKSCEYCITLPPLGQLPFLKELQINGMSRVETIGPEFYGMIGGSTNSPFQPFPSLEKLQFKKMSNWKEMLSFRDSNFPLPRLKTLYLNQCIKLRGHLPSNLPCIEKITMFWCDCLLATPSNLPWLSIYESTTPVTEWGLQNLRALSDLEIGGYNIVHTLLKEQLLPNFLVSLTIANLPEMKCLEGNGLHHISSMKNLTFKFCSGTESFQAMLPSFLKSLIFVTCPKLKSLPHMLPSSLESLKFDDCPRLGLFPGDEFPSSLKLLNINGCPLLTARYANWRSRHVSKIAHIPVIKINFEVII